MWRQVASSHREPHLMISCSSHVFSYFSQMKLLKFVIYLTQSTTCGMLFRLMISPVAPISSYESRPESNATESHSPIRHPSWHLAACAHAIASHNSRKMSNALLAVYSISLRGERETSWKGRVSHSIQRHSFFASLQRKSDRLAEQLGIRGPIQVKV